MSFASELATLMNANTGINSTVDGIYRDTTGTEFKASNNWIIYTYKRDADIGVLGDKSAIKMFTLYTEVYTDKASDTESICEALRSYLIDFTTDTIRDITFRNETHTNLPDVNNNVAYITLMEFGVTYQN